MKKDNIQDTNFPNSIRKMRETKGWSQYELENHSGVPQRYIDRYEKRNDVPFPIILKLAIALECTIFDLYPNDVENISKAFGFNYIKALRKSTGLSESELAKTLGISQEEYQQFETSKQIDGDVSLQIASAIIFMNSAKAALRQSSQKYKLSKPEEAIIGSFRGLNEQEQVQAAKILDSLSSLK